jgi:hypothetical protein
MVLSFFHVWEILYLFFKTIFQIWFFFSKALENLFLSNKIKIILLKKFWSNLNSSKLEVMSVDIQEIETLKSLKTVINLGKIKYGVFRLELFPPLRFFLLNKAA